MDQYINVDGRMLRKGYTTGTCAAAAAKAAAIGLISGDFPSSVSVQTADGTIEIELESAGLVGTSAVAAVRKDSGDDPDVTNGILVCARVALSQQDEITIIGGKGVGRVTKPGLRVPVGEAAINPAPKRQIIQEVASVLPPDKGVIIEISVPEGEEIARRTFNPKLGIEGGISILGTTGVVKPMSEEAYRDSLALKLDILAAAGERACIMAFGEYGKDFSSTIDLDPERFVMVGNFIGYLLDHAVVRGFERVLLIGHLGKIVKVAAGVFHTHNRYGDARMETLAAYAGLEGASRDVIAEIFACVTTSAVVEILDRERYEGVYSKLAAAIKRRCEDRTCNAVSVEVIVYTDNQRLLAQTSRAVQFITELKRDNSQGKVV